MKRNREKKKLKQYKKIVIQNNFNLGPEKKEFDGNININISILGVKEKPPTSQQTEPQEPPLSSHFGSAKQVRNLSQKKLAQNKALFEERNAIQKEKYPECKGKD